MVKLKPAFIIILLFCAMTCIGQNTTFDVNVEFQAYPTGLIPGIRLEKGFAKNHAVHLRLGYQFIDHGSQGKHFDETGTGYGFTLGYKHYFRENFKGFNTSLRSDLWFNRIDWKTVKPLPSSGVTNIVVLQPTFETGWMFKPGENIILQPSVALGYEINVKTEGEPTGEGAILLLGLTFGYRFSTASNF